MSSLSYDVTQDAVRNDTDKLVDTLRACISSGEMGPYFQSLRESGVAYIPVTFRAHPQLAHQLCCQVLEQVASESIAAAYALENHLFLLGALSTYLRLHDSSQLEALLERVAADRLLVANTTTAVHTSSALSFGSQVQKEDGSYFVNGSAAFVSLASYADLLWLQSQSPDGTVILLIDMNQRSPTLEDLTFPNIMMESDTRRVRFENLQLPSDALIEVPPESLMPGGALRGCLLAWHLSLAAAQFLGGALGAIDEVREFVRDMKTWNGQPFSQLPHVLSEVGRMEIRYTAAKAILNSVSPVVAAIGAETDPSDLELRTLHRVRTAKHFVSSTAEEIVTAARRMIGTRTFAGGHRLERLSYEIMVAPMAPRASVLLEQEVGRAALDDRSIRSAVWEWEKG